MFHKHHGNGVGWRQGSRTSKSGKGCNGRMTLFWLMGGCVVKKVWTTRLNAKHTRFFPLA